MDFGSGATESTPRGGGVPIFVFAMVILFFCVGAFATWKSFFADKPPAMAEARVVDIRVRDYADGSRSRFPIVAFTDDKGQQHEVESMGAVNGNMDGGSVGDTTTIFYYPENPERGYVIGFNASTLGILGIGFMIGSFLVFLLLLHVRRKNMRQRL